MCGIFGIVDRTYNSIHPRQLSEAVECLHHRGPDDEGYLLFNAKTGWVSACAGADTPADLELPQLNTFTGAAVNVAFGFRRLSILDLSPAGHQPMSSADGRYWIVMNGEIYNYIELRNELSQLGWQFFSGSDTEVLLAAYQQWGPGSLQRFVGMFAFAVLDCKSQQLFLARDFFGIKPLYYVSQLDYFAFASEPQALLCLPWVKRRVNPQVLSHYLRFGRTDLDGQTFFDGLFQLEPGHFMEVDINHPGSPVSSRYWSLDAQPEQISFPEAVAGIRSRFEENVRLHLRSDVPLGAALSGGIDSSAIVMTMRRILGQQLDLHTFSYIANQEKLNEEKWVDLVSTAANARVYKTRPQPVDLVAELDHLIYIHGEPFISTSIFAQHMVFKAAKQAGITVMEDGQGADEMLAGYPGFLSHRLASLVRQGKIGPAWNFARSVTKNRSEQERLDFFANAARHIAPESVLRSGMRLVGRDAAWLDDSWFSRHGVEFPALRVPPARDQLRAALLASFNNNLPMLLRYEDRNSMAFSIESRVPFLTPDLVKFVLSLPEEWIINQEGVTKFIFRQAMRGTVPDMILSRMDKIGFATPEQDWLKLLGPWVDGFINGEAAHSIGALRLPEIQRDWEAIQNGRRRFNSRVWRWVNLIRWIELYQIDGR